ncbi:unnamed protein product [Dimorphilus gyrociliatus]|uniref:Uncharacterized protein n=1 Tax=Dimorphilus gyrociliatus TaxID=2664684 RepID=A0A7I8WEM4_9ANNE|nr:unnamed protein product [Dimorphilus gyrociliatus]
MAHQNNKVFKFKSKKTKINKAACINLFEDDKIERDIQQSALQNQQQTEVIQVLTDDCNGKNEGVVEGRKEATMTQYFVKKRKNEVVDILQVPKASCSKDSDEESDIEVCLEVCQPKKKKTIKIVQISSSQSSESSTEELMRKVATSVQYQTHSKLFLAEDLKRKLLHQQKCDDISVESGLTVFVRRKSDSFINFMESFCNKKSYSGIDIPQLIRQVPPKKDIKSQYLIVTDTSFDYDKKVLALNILKYGLDGELYVIHIEDLMASDLPVIFNDWKIECQQIVIHLPEHPITINNYLDEFYQKLKLVSGLNKMFICITIKINNEQKHCNYPYNNCDQLVEVDMKNNLKNSYVETYQFQHQQTIMKNPYISIIEFLANYNKEYLLNVPDLKKLVDKHNIKKAMSKKDKMLES